MTEMDVGVAASEAGSWSFERFAGLCAVGAGLGGVAYSLAFVIGLDSDADVWQYAQALILLVGGLLSTAVFVALYERLRPVDPAFALWALLLGLVGAVGSALHGGHDLANLLNPPEIATSGPSYVDPRGLGTFGLAGLAMLVFSLLALRPLALPRRLCYLGVLAAALFVWVYLGRLIVLDAKSLAVLPFAVALGFVVSPAWYVWVGLTLRRVPRR